MSQSIAPVAVLVAHRVADYDSWKKTFDAHEPARKEASCLGHHINRGADDPNMIYIYSPGTDVDKVKAFVSSTDLGEVMKTAGVIGPPAVTLMKPMSADFIPDQKLAGIIVTHRVESYETWRASFDDFDDHRKQSGIVGHAVNQELGNPNQVVVYHQANDLATLRSFVDSTELKERMQRAGVIGTPNIQFVQVADFSDY